MTDTPTYSTGEVFVIFLRMLFFMSLALSIIFGWAYSRMVRELRETQEQYFQAINLLHHEINRLRCWSFEKSPHYKQLTPDQIKVAQSFNEIPLGSRSKAQQRIVDQYHDWMLKTGQTFEDREPEVILPPDDSGDWRWNSETQFWDHKGGTMSNIGRRAASSSVA
jgi:hypothetical protein